MSHKNHAVFNLVSMIASAPRRKCCTEALSENRWQSKAHLSTPMGHLLLHPLLHNQDHSALKTALWQSDVLYMTSHNIRKIQIHPSDTWLPRELVPIAGTLLMCMLAMTLLGFFVSYCHHHHGRDPRHAPCAHAPCVHA